MHSGSLIMALPPEGLQLELKNIPFNGNWITFWLSCPRHAWLISFNCPSDEIDGKIFYIERKTHL